MSCFDKESALYGLTVLKSLVKTDVKRLADSDRIEFASRGAEIRRVGTSWQTHASYEERLSIARGAPLQSSFTSVRDSSNVATSSIPSLSGDRVTITSGKRVRKVFLLHDHYKVGWLLDGCASRCFACKVRFSPAFRRHHCRACGNIYCSKCTDLRISVSNVSVRACVLCHTRFNCRSLWALDAFLERANAYEASDNSPAGATGRSALPGVVEEEDGAENESFLSATVVEGVMHSEVHGESWGQVCALEANRGSGSSRSSGDAGRANNYGATLETIGIDTLSSRLTDIEPYFINGTTFVSTERPPASFSNAANNYSTAAEQANVDVGLGTSPDDICDTTSSGRDSLFGAALSGSGAQVC